MEFQDKFKKAYNQNDLDWDKNSMWDSIEKELPPKKKKRRFLWLFFGTGLALIPFILLIYNNSNIENIDNYSLGDASAIISKPIIISQPIINSTSLNNTKSALKIDDDLIKNDVEKSFENGDTVEKSRSNNIEDWKKSDLQKGQFIDEKKMKTYQSLSYDSAGNLILFPNSNGRIQSNDVLGETENSTLMGTQNLSNVDKVFAPQLYLELASIEGIVLSKIKYSSKMDLSNLGIVLSASPQPINANNYELAFKSFVGLTNQNVISMSPAFNEFTNLHSASKSVQESIGAELIVKRNLWNRFTIGVGMAYFTSFEWYSGEDVKIVEEEFESIMGAYYVVNGVKNYIPSNLSQTTSTTTLYRSPSRRHYLDIPVELAYIFNLMKLRFQAFAKYNFNVSHRLTGRTYSDELNLLESSNPKIQNMFKSHSVNSYSYGLDALYAINKYFAGSIGFYYRKQSISSFSELINVDERYNSYGISLGLSYRLH